MRQYPISYPQPGNNATPADRGNACSRLVGNKPTFRRPWTGDKIKFFFFLSSAYKTFPLVNFWFFGVSDFFLNLTHTLKPVLRTRSFSFRGRQGPPSQCNINQIFGLVLFPKFLARKFVFCCCCPCGVCQLIPSVRVLILFWITVASVGGITWGAIPTKYCWKIWIVCAVSGSAPHSYNSKTS